MQLVAKPESAPVEAQSPMTRPVSFAQDGDFEPQPMLRKPTRTSTKNSTVRRRLSINPHHVNNIRTLSRAVNLAAFTHFAIPTIFTLPGDASSDGRQSIALGPSIHKHLRFLYDDWRKGEPTLSREHFSDFLKECQGESVDIEAQLTKERYRFREFVDTWWSCFGLDSVKEMPIDEKDLQRPISNYFISSSHNTYLNGHQWLGHSSASAYRQVLEDGCRCIEIDVWDEAPNPSSSSQDTGDEKTSTGGGLGIKNLHAAAAYGKKVVLEKKQRARKMLGMEKQHSRRGECSHTFKPPGMPQNTSTMSQWAAEHSLSGTSSDLSKGRTRDEPIVMHGYTLTSPVGFREVCRAVRKSAFKTSKLPLIVSLEVHADHEQQGAMVRIMKEEWGPWLMDTPYEDCPAGPNGRMPRLSELQEKILIKVKRASPSDGPGTNSTLAPSTSVLDDDASCSDDGGSFLNFRPRKVTICDALSALGIYTHSEHFESFEGAAAKVPSHIFSLKEAKILDFDAAKTKQLLDHNRHFMTRMYPNPSRVDSSNPDPSLFWRKGVQMVALNWQKCDEGMMINHAMFTGEHGWILKPPSLVGEVPTLSDTPAPHLHNLYITILAAQHIPLPEGYNHRNVKSFRPVVKCELLFEKHDSPSGGEVEYKRKTAPGKTDNTDFPHPGNKLEFTKLPKMEPQMSFVKFKIEDAATLVNPKASAWACIRLDRLQQGYRFLHLYNTEGKRTRGIIFALIQKQPMPDR